MRRPFIIRLSIIFIVLGLLLPAGANALYEQTVGSAKKISVPPIAPLEPLQPETGTTIEPAPTTPPPASQEADPFALPTGMFGWGKTGELAGSAMIGNGWYLDTGCSLVMADPWQLGEKLGLAEDAVVYKAGLAFGFGNTGAKRLFSLLQGAVETTVYLKEGSLLGFDPFTGLSLALNLSGTDNSAGGLGLKIFGGIITELGFGLGRTEIAVGYASQRSGPAYSAEGIFCALRKPLVF